MTGRHFQVCSGTRCLFRDSLLASQPVFFHLNNNSLAPLIELDGQADDFILCDVERLHHLARFQLTVLCVEVPPPLHLICEQDRGRHALTKSLLILTPVMTSATLPLNNPGTSL